MLVFSNNVAQLKCLPVTAVEAVTTGCSTEGSANWVHL